MRTKKSKRQAIIRAAMKHGPHKKARAYVAHRLKALRTHRGLLQEELSVAAGLHRTYVGVIERQEKGVGIDVLGQICDAMNLTLEEFFDPKFK